MKLPGVPLGKSKSLFAIHVRVLLGRFSVDGSNVYVKNVAMCHARISRMAGRPTSEPRGPVRDGGGGGAVPREGA